jgi:hypothetical protein
VKANALPDRIIISNNIINSSFIIIIIPSSVRWDVRSIIPIIIPPFSGLAGRLLIPVVLINDNFCHLWWHGDYVLLSRPTGPEKSGVETNGAPTKHYWAHQLSIIAKEKVPTTIYYSSSGLEGRLS